MGNLTDREWELLREEQTASQSRIEAQGRRIDAIEERVAVLAVRVEIMIDTFKSGRGAMIALIVGVVGTAVGIVFFGRPG